MLSLDVKSEELVDRLLERGKESGRADDQNRDIISNRINEYNNKTAPLKEYYLAQEKLILIQGVGTITEINDKLCRAIDQI
jgi:adenylate kinase